MGIQDMGGEAVLIAAGGRSILLQIADPAIGHGVAGHSDFAARPLDRLRGTLTYVYAVTFGTEDEAAQATRQVNRAHGPVRGDGADGTPAYSAFTPELQLWVAATLYDSAVTMHELVYGPMEDEVADTVYREYASLGTALQVPPDLWPPDRAAFRAYWRRRLTELRTDATTRSVAVQLLHPRTGPVWLRLAMPLGRLLTVGLLPPEVHRLYNLPWTAASQRRFDRTVRLIAVVYPALPRRLRHWPKEHFLRALRASVKPGTSE
ncbi:oxygenase MpaB family protein [Cryobacterium sp. Sr8]|uniref:oxygenase MpaB family protein n=1 Tax=Cryobacterium sp. Sr8 TaxID=1259203 RepID=UPI00351116C1